MKYNPQKIEKKWQALWEQKKLGAAEDFSAKPKYYCLFEFPYPSGAGLHVGHVRPFVGTDVIARFKRMQGYNVLYPVGWDAFGLPTENFAIKNKIHPRIATDQNIKNFKKQMKIIGISVDWDREIDTTDPKYYTWTQWIFLKLYKAGMAYRAEVPIHWCPSCKTGLANEEVIDGKHERCGHTVEEKLKKQWLIRITKYADRLIEDLKSVDFPERVKTQQINWIGRSEGAEIDFEVRTEEKPNFVLLHGYGGSPETNFFPWLRKELEKRGYRVQAPLLPHSDKSRANEKDDMAVLWKSVQFDHNTILVAHSLGTIVAMKALEKLQNPIRKLVLVGGFLEPKFRNHDRSFTQEFYWNFDFGVIRKNAGQVVILHDKNDFAIPYDQGKKLLDGLGGELFEPTPRDTHFCAIEEPEVLRHALDMVSVFTTRPDTLFGATYMVIAPEHQLILNLKSKISNLDEVEEYIARSCAKTNEERIAEGKEKMGVEIKGITAINPANGEEIPMWVADYVLGNVGTGAIMAVPGHDERDFAFAEKYGLPIKMVVCPHYPAPTCPVSDVAYTGVGYLVDSGKFNGMPSEEAKDAITEFVGGMKKVQYRLRDWVFSRQRYWGEPIPIVYCEKCGEVPVPEKDLPLLLPDVKNYEPTETGESPLATIKSFVETKCPVCGGPAQRETDTMPNWAGSNWYFLRYLDPRNEKAFADRKKIDYWMPVDLYNGGMEHTTLHLLYSRFIYKFLYDQGLVPHAEPYAKRTTHGVIVAEDNRKMSKSFGNVINPDDIVKEYGADALRMYEMFIAPFEQMVAWNGQGVVGVRRFLDRVWKFYEREFSDAATNDADRIAHKLVKKVGEDISAMKFNTAVSAFMESLNSLEQCAAVSRSSARMYLLALAPFAPHLTAELWEKIGEKKSIHEQPWPEYNEAFIHEDTFALVVQINGKMRATTSLPVGASQEDAEKAARAHESVVKHLEGKIVKKVVFVPERLLNFVAPD